MISAMNTLTLFSFLGLLALNSCATSSQQQGQQQAQNAQVSNNVSEDSEDLANDDNANDFGETDQFTIENGGNNAAINSDATNEFMANDTTDTSAFNPVSNNTSNMPMNAGAEPVANSWDSGTAAAAPVSDPSQVGSYSNIAQPATLDATAAAASPAPANGVQTVYESVSQLPKCGL